jgi:hypothetical protein
MKAESSFETSGTIYPATLRHNPDSSITPVWKPRNFNDFEVNLKSTDKVFLRCPLLTSCPRNDGILGEGRDWKKTGNSSEFIFRCTYCWSTPTP